MWVGTGCGKGEGGRTADREYLCWLQHTLQKTVYISK